MAAGAQSWHLSRDNCSFLSSFSLSSPAANHAHYSQRSTGGKCSHSQLWWGPHFSCLWLAIGVYKYFWCETIITRTGTRCTMQHTLSCSSQDFSSHLKSSLWAICSCWVSSEGSFGPLGYFWFELRKVDTDTVLKINSRSSHNKETKRIWGFQNRVAVFFKSQVDKEIEIRRTKILLVPPIWIWGE